jgi:hypothetical protein
VNGDCTTCRVEHKENWKKARDSSPTAQQLQLGFDDHLGGELLVLVEPHRPRRGVVADAVEVNPPLRPARQAVEADAARAAK